MKHKINQTEYYFSSKNGSHYGPYKTKKEAKKALVEICSKGNLYESFTQIDDESFKLITEDSWGRQVTCFYKLVKSRPLTK